MPPEQSIDWFNLLLFGDPGVGKTHLLGTAADDSRTSPVLILDVDGGITTVRNKQVEVVQIRTMKQLQDVANNLYNHNDDYYKTVCIDTGTELQKLDMAYVMSEAKRKASNPDKIEEYVPSPREWGISGERMRLIVRTFRDLPMNFIMTAHLNEAQLDTGGSKAYPSIPGKLRNELAGFFDIEGYYKTVSKKDGDKVTITRELQTLGTDKVQAKDRFTALGDLMINPTIPMIYEAIINSNDNDTKG